MNKKVIALAVAGALALPLAATAQTANVTMYGSIRLAMDSTDIQGVGRTNAINSWSSRWGIRGIEVIGGGLNGIFQFETGIQADAPGGVALDTSGATVVNRNNAIVVREAWVGLNGGFGTIKMGAGLTPYDDVLGMDHLLLANGYEGLTTLGGGVSPAISGSGNFTNYGSFGAGGTANASTNYDARYGNGVRYDSPNFSGLTFATHFAFLGENATGTKAKGWDSAVKYLNGPIELGLGYARHIDFSQYDGNAWRVHAGYNFGVAKLIGAYERMSYDGNNGTVGDATVRYYSVGVSAPVGPGTITAQYHNRNKGATTSATAVTEVANGGGKAYSVSYKYGFSKRTYAYAWAARVKADSAASVGGGPAGNKATSLGFGLQHNF